MIALLRHSVSWWLIGSSELFGPGGTRSGEPRQGRMPIDPKWSVKLPRNRLRGSVKFRLPQDLAWRTKGEYLECNGVVGGERASSVRQRYAGKICCECKAPLPPLHRRGERLCQRCTGVSMKRVFLQFSFRHGWFCDFLEEDRKTRLPRTAMLPDERKLFELAKRGGFPLNISGRQEIEDAIRKKRGGVWLGSRRSSTQSCGNQQQIRQDHFILPAPRPSASCHHARR